MVSLAIHSVFCGHCGGWVEPVANQICDHEIHICCSTCADIVASVRTVEQKIENHGEG